MDLQTRKEKLDTLNKKLKKKKLMAILLAIFSLGANAFAWFVFTTTSDVKVNGRVASWDVQLRDENDQFISSIIIDVDMEPGMLEVNRRYEIDNRSEVTVDLNYTINSFKLMGREVDLSGVTDAESYLKTFYPFTVEIATDGDTIDVDETGAFSVKVNWDYEKANTYFSLNEIYDYTNGFLYYKKEGTSYNVFNVTSSNYLANRSSLYLEKDDADTYFGMQCAKYQKETEKTCLELSLTVVIEQHNG